MRFTNLLAPAVLAMVVTAQTPLEFPIVTEDRLTVVYELSYLNLTNSPGMLVPRSDVLTAPAVYRPSGADSDLFVVMMIDTDVPRNSGRVELLHWLQPNLVAADNGNLTVDVVARGASAAVGASYIPPNPPQGDGPHRYTFLLFTQPEGWTIPADYSTINPPADTSARIGFNITDFVATTGLGEPLAGAYFRVLNGTAAETHSAMQATGSAAPATTGAEPTNTASGTSSAGSPGATGNAASGHFEPVGSVKELVMGLALAMVGACAWML